MTAEIAVDTVYALALAPDQLGACFAARESGLYRSDDGARTWRPMYGSLALAAPLATTAVLAVGAASAGLFAGVPGGILRSHDGGASWHVTMLPGAPTVSALAASPALAPDATLFAATLGDGVLLSLDAGATWAHWSFGLLDMQVLGLAVAPDFAHEQTVYAGTETGLWRSTNGGRSWRELALPCDAPVTSIALAPDRVILIGTEGAGLWLSSTGGASWSACPAPIGDAAIAGLGARSLAPGHVAIDLATSTALLRSYDGGATWATIVEYDQADDEIIAAAFDQDVLVLGHANGRIAMLDVDVT